MKGKYARDGRKIDLVEWGMLLANADYQRVALTEDGDVRVSTVWIGLDHQYGTGPPLIFETMVFGGSGDEDTDRYSTEEEAVSGHAAMCLKYGIEFKQE